MRTVLSTNCVLFLIKGRRTYGPIIDRNDAGTRKRHIHSRASRNMVKTISENVMWINALVPGNTDVLRSANVWSRVVNCKVSNFELSICASTYNVSVLDKHELTGKRRLKDIRSKCAQSFVCLTYFGNSVTPAPLFKFVRLIKIQYESG